MTKSLTQQQHAFHLEEYATLRAEILAAQQERRVVNRVGAAGIIGIYSWLLLKAPDLASRPLMAALWLVPTAIGVICFRITDQITRSIRMAAQYLGLIEARCAAEDLKGWHVTLADIRARRETRHSVLPPGKRLQDVMRLDLQSGFTHNTWLVVTWLTICAAVLGVADILDISKGATRP